MTGASATSWSFASRTLIAGAVVVAESTWVSLLINTAVNGSAGPHVHLPLFVLTVPSVAAAAVGAAVTRLGWRWWWRGAVLVPTVVAGAAVSAGLTSMLTRSGSFWRTATQPWSATGHPAAVTAGAAWFVAALAWGRGAWLGTAPPSLRHAAWSVGLGGIAFVGVFAGRADAGATAFRAATGPAGWLLFLGFPFATAAIALVREHDLEQQVLLQARSQPGTVWLTVLAVPMLAVALVALLLAVIVGPVAPVVGRAAARAAEATWWLVAAAFSALARLLPTGHSRPVVSPTQPGQPSRAVPLPRPVHAGAFLPAIVWQILAGVVVIGLVAAIGHVLRGWYRPRPSPGGVAGDDTHDSVFTWRHLASQVRNGLRAMLGRLRPRRRRDAPVPVAAMAADEDPGAESVRHAYRRMLTAARTSGSARAASETTRELEGRLARGPAAGAADALAGLTATYDAVRYGEVVIEEPARDHAVAQADLVSSALRPPAAPASPDRPPSRGRHPTPP